MTDGLLVIDKAPGPTSHDVVDQVRKLFSTRKVGHSGTLDPPATGILLVGIGKATRLLAFLQSLPKTYRADVKFGVSTSTQDAQGEIIEERACSFSKDDLEQTAANFVGEIEQTPPMVSAVKVGGRALYRAARRGEEVERKARKVRVYELAVNSFDPADYIATMTVLCSSGTYVRTLASDLGDRLACGGHVLSLRRLSVGSFSETEAISIEALQTKTFEERMPHVYSMAVSMRDFPSVVVGEEDARAVTHGRPIETHSPERAGELPVVAIPRIGGVPPHEAGMTAGIPVAVLDKSGALLAVYRRTRGALKPAAVVADS